ncbi:NAD-dependent epimerase/dehydratase family protein [Pseudomonas grimontii]|uniref:NAD-dependent epimerase/dehydratase family protein n=1 Tax=Pseudomonas grimontii TaxID=129847 RepID=UPI0021688A6B|nr:NAD-dependent epimerase/dehydratase family protein [Pseudomonas grimontii]MCS3513540.1 UDP-glucose 4-epimerase [Pseudomonas grimontii]
MTERSKIVVTGADGFIGRELVKYLRERAAGEVVRCVRPSKSGPDDLAYDLSGCGPMPALHGVDVIVHAAARVHVRQIESDPLPAFRAANVAGTMRLAEAAASAGVRRFVFISSIAANGNATPVGRPFTPSDIPAPQDPYGVTKLEAEQALLALSERTAMEVVIVRPALVYGPGAGGNVQQMLKWLRFGVPLPLAGIDNRRSFVSLYNLVDLLALCTIHPAAAGEVFLASDAEVVSTSMLLSALARHLGRGPRLFWVPKSLLGVIAAAVGKRAWVDILFRSLTADISKNVRLLGWSPPQSFDDGIKVTVQTATNRPVT